jgi:hypothetical protein
METTFRPLTWKWLAITVVIALAATVRWCPSTKIMDDYAQGELTAVSRVPGMVQQLHNPWVGLETNKRFSTYLYFATRWRLLPPFAGHMLRLSPTTYLKLTQLGAWWLLLLGTGYAYHLGGTKAALVAALGLAGSSAWLSSVEMVQFDGWCWSLLLITTFTPRKFTAWTVIALGPWVDERFILFLPAALLIRMGRDGELPWRELTALTPYIAVRATALLMGDSQLGAQVARSVRQDWSLGWFTQGWALSWRMGWLLLAVGAVSAILAVKPILRWPIIACIAGGLAVAALATDTTRTAAGLLPLAVLGSARLPRSRWLASALVVAVLLNFALPYWHSYGDLAPVLSVFSPPPGTWVMPF